MAENDPYQPPATELRAPAHLGPEGEVLASRESRLGAAIIDSIIIMAARAGMVRRRFIPSTRR